MAHFFLSAAHKSSGKTTVAIGLCAALRRQGLVVQPFKKGPDFIDPMWLGLAAQRPCYSLDFFTMALAEIDERFAHRMAGCELGVIEGNKGLYDGLDLEGGDSNAALARRLQAPVVLVLDVRGMTRGVAPLLLGYQAFDPQVRFAGVILNRLGGARHEAKVRAVVERYTDLEVLGALHRAPSLEIVERHLGLVPSNELSSALGRVREIERYVASHVALHRIVHIAHTAPRAGAAVITKGASVGTHRLRIGIFRDAAFGFYYPADLEAFVDNGAELIPIDALGDQRLPRVDGLFIGGGFPESHMAELASNHNLRGELREAIEQGLPVYAECGGLMYLARTLTWGGRRAEMVGAIPGDAVMYPAPRGRGYVRLRETDAFPWPRLAPGAFSLEIAAHEFHHSSLENLPPQMTFGYQVVRGNGVDGRHDGIVSRNLLASYAHLSHGRANPWVARFLAFVASCGHYAHTGTG